MIFDKWRKKHSSIEQQLEEYLSKESAINASDLPQYDQKPLTQIIADTIKSDHEEINKLLKNILGPQLHENENQKRKLKNKLINFMLAMLIVQSLLVFLPVLCIIISSCFKIPFLNMLTLDQQELIFNFLKYYVTAVIAEFLTMLYFVIRYVFDKSIVDLVKELVKQRNNGPE